MDIEIIGTHRNLVFGVQFNEYMATYHWYGGSFKCGELWNGYFCKTKEEATNRAHEEFDREIKRHIYFGSVASSEAIETMELQEDELHAWHSALNSMVPGEKIIIECRK